MPDLTVQISRFIDEHQPGFVECVLIDASGQSHFFVEKVPIVTIEDLGPKSVYPRAGMIGCEIESEWTDEAGQVIASVNTERPWGVTSTSGVTKFTVFSTQVVRQ